MEFVITGDGTKLGTWMFFFFLTLCRFPSLKWVKVSVMLYPTLLIHLTLCTQKLFLQKALLSLQKNNVSSKYFSCEWSTNTGVILTCTITFNSCKRLPFYHPNSNTFCVHLFACSLAAKRMSCTFVWKWSETHVWAKKRIWVCQNRRLFVLQGDVRLMEYFSPMLQVRSINPLWPQSTVVTWCDKSDEFSDMV